MGATNEELMRLMAVGTPFEITVEDGTPVQVVAGPVSVDGSPVQTPGFRAPLLGEHTG